jgi:alpha-tubulin suppressor-like RCC1 family protein
LWACGYNNNGQLGDGTITSRSSPVQVGALTNWKQVACGRYHTVAVKTDGTLWTWGNDAYGQLGDGTVANKSSPIQVGSLTTWKQVAGGQYHTIAIKEGGDF